jgi:serine/threonine protein kinase
LSEQERVLAGRYQVGELIGRGGMADVFEGVDLRLGRKVAIKLLKSDLASDETFESRFAKEAQASAKMAHPTIVRIYDAGEELSTDSNGNQIKTPFIIMEYVNGKLLRDLMHEKKLTLQEAVDFAKGVLTALEISHKAGIIHRDIKASNIMVTAQGQVKVMDFGIARAISDSSETQAHTAGIVGTAQYFSPEQARGEAVDSRTDLYSMGVLLYEMLAGRRPFGLHEHLSDWDVARLINTAELQSIATYSSVNSFLKACLQVRVCERISSAVEMKALLSKIIQNPHKIPEELLLRNSRESSAASLKADVVILAFTCRLESEAGVHGELQQITNEILRAETMHLKIATKPNKHDFFNEIRACHSNVRAIHFSGHGNNESGGFLWEGHGSNSTEIFPDLSSIRHTCVYIYICIYVDVVCIRNSRPCMYCRYFFMYMYKLNRPSRNRQFRSCEAANLGDMEDLRPITADTWILEAQCDWDYCNCVCWHNHSKT